MEFGFSWSKSEYKDALKKVLKVKYFLKILQFYSFTYLEKYIYIFLFSFIYTNI